MNAKRRNKLSKLQELAAEIEVQIELMKEEVDFSIENLQDNDMDHLPAFESLEEDSDGLQEAMDLVGDFFSHLESLI